MECNLLEILPAEVSGPEVCSFFLKRDDYHVLLELKPYCHELNGIMFCLCNSPLFPVVPKYQSYLEYPR